jgi:hypothetical protein
MIIDLFHNDNGMCIGFPFLWFFLFLLLHANNHIPRYISPSDFVVSLLTVSYI